MYWLACLVSLHTWKEGFMGPRPRYFGLMGESQAAKSLRFQMNDRQGATIEVEVVRWPSI